MLRFKRRWNTITCNEGFSVKMSSILGGLVYVENGRRVEIDSEPSLGPQPGMIVYERSVASWTGPAGEEPIQTEDRERIILNLTRALAFAGFATHIA